MSDERVSCQELADLMKPVDRVAVLVLLKSDPPNGMQLVTFGRSAEDKSESHQLKEWIKNKVLGGETPKIETHESFILDAAKNRQAVDALTADLARVTAERDRLRAACVNVLSRIEQLQEQWGKEGFTDGTARMLREAINPTTT